MRKQRSQYRGTQDRRLQIIEAALACFTKQGFNNTTMEDIRSRSGASNGSIYHHFKNKEQLAASVYLQGILEYQRQLIEDVAKAADAHAGILAIIKHHIKWVCDHPDWARFLFRMRHADFMVHAEKTMSEANKEFETALGKFFRTNVANSTIRSLSKELYISIIFGPCQELSRSWLSEKIPDNPGKIIRELGESVWRSIKNDEEPAAAPKPLSRQK